MTEKHLTSGSAKTNTVAENSTAIETLMLGIWNVVALTLCLAVVVTLASFLAPLHWVADLLANLRVQQLIGLVALTLLAACFRRWRWLLMCVVLLILNGLWIVAGSPASYPDRDAIEQQQRVAGKSQNASPGESEQGDTTGPGDYRDELVVMVANVLTSNSQHEIVLQQIQRSDADVFAILELGTPLQAFLEKELAQTYPHRSTSAQDRGNFGIGLYSRVELNDVEIFSLNIDSIRSIAATVRRGGTLYRIVATHPLPPMSAEGFRNRNEHLEQLGERLRQTSRDNPEPRLVVMGDLNLTPWSPLFSDFLSTNHLRRTGNGLGIQPTWFAAAKASLPFGLVLDHVLIGDGLDCQEHKIGPGIGSDHRAVTVKLFNTRRPKRPR